jgi:hypothetical protein
VEILPVGISDAPGTLQWIPDPDRPFNAVILPGYLSGNESEDIRVPIETLDEVIGRLDWDRLDFIKIDVEGMELEVFSGAQRTLAKYRPVVLFESMSWARDYRRQKSGIDIFREIANLLAEIGYRTFELTPTGELHKRTNLDTWPNNMLAIPVRHSRRRKRTVEYIFGSKRRGRRRSPASTPISGATGRMDDAGQRGRGVGHAQNLDKARVEQGRDEVRRSRQGV